MNMFASYLLTRSIKIFDHNNIGFIATTYKPCSGRYGTSDQGFLNFYIAGEKCVELPKKTAHLVFWAPVTRDNRNEYKMLSELDGSGDLQVEISEQIKHTGLKLM